jgi:hypothetical protein
LCYVHVLNCLFLAEGEEKEERKRGGGKHLYG